MYVKFEHSIALIYLVTICEPSGNSQGKQNYSCFLSLMFAVFLNLSPQEKDNFSGSDTSGSEENIRVLQMAVEPRLILIYFIRETDTKNQYKITTSKQRKTME